MGRDKPPAKDTRFALAHLGYKDDQRYWNDLDFEAPAERRHDYRGAHLDGAWVWRSRPP